MGNAEKSLTVKTNHKHPIYFAIHYQYPSGTWYTKGWWSVTNTSRCYPNITTDNNYLYFHAHCNVCGAEWGNSNHQFLCHEYESFDHSGNPSNRDDYEYKDFNETYFNSTNCTYTFY